MRSRNYSKGLTLIETLITLAVLTAVMVGLYALLDSSNKLAKQETNVAEAQQSVRIGISEVTRVVRQGRVGGLFIANAILPVANNSGAGSTLTDISGTAHYIRAGTDVIGVRGIISGDKYGLATGDVTCGASCATTTAMTVTIRATSASGVVNFLSGTSPAIAGKTRPFYFVVADGSTEMVTTGVGTYLVPVYYVGLVDANSSGTWFTQTANAFTFSMNPQDADALKLTAAPPSSTTLDKPFSGGVVDEIRFFVDEGPTDASSSALDTHPSLAEAVFDPSSRNWEIQPLIEDVEDFQVAYGVDGIDGTPHDHGISPAAYDLSGSNRDEWVGNVANEVTTTLPLTSSDPKRVEAFIDSSIPTGPSAPALAVAALRSVMVGLVVKSADPDFRYNGPGARGFALFDSTARSFSSASSTGRPYRRRLQRFAVSLRNYQ
jgi:Type IV Pilus-assembly protein W/Prokaryotic N-terminal methylation motif